MAIVGPRKVHPPLYNVNSATNNRTSLANYSITESEKESRDSHDTSSDDAGVQQYTNGVAGRPPAFGSENSLLAAGTAKDGGMKRRKPKTNIVKSNSSFVSRVIQHDSMLKRLQERNPEGTFAFANINRAFQWLDLTGNNAYRVRRSLSPLIGTSY